MPNSWPNSVSTASTYRPLQYSTTSCSRVGSTGPLKNILQCDVLLTDQKISVYQAYGTAVTTPTSISFTVLKIKTPPTTASSYTITIGT